MIKELEPLLKNRKSLYVTLLISLVYIVPILIADFNYLDDYGRDLYGYGWQHDGRFIATFLGKLWSLNSTIVSIYPFSLILSALILGFTGYLVVSLLKIEDNKTLKWSSLLILTSPFFLGNIVFKYDCLPMAMSFLCVVFPFVFYNNKVKFAISAFAGVFLAFGLYQPTATTFLILACAFIVQTLFKDNFKRLVQNGLIVISAFVFAYFVHILIVKFCNLPTSGRDELILFKSNFIENLLFNQTQYLERLLSLMNTGNYKYLSYFFIACTVLGVMFSVVHKSIFKSIFSILLIFTLFIAAFYLIPSVNMLLKESYWDLRSFTGLGFIGVLAMFFQSFLPNKIQFFSRLSCGLIVAFSFILAAQFSRMLNNQTEYQRYFVTELNALLKNKPITKIAFIGLLPNAPKNEFAYHNFPIFQNLLGKPISQFSAWNKPILDQYGRFRNIDFINGEELKCKGILIEDAYLYHVKEINGTTLVIDFNKTTCI